MLLKWLALNFAAGLGPVRVARLVEQFGPPDSILDQPAENIARCAGIPIEAAKGIKDPSLIQQAQKQIDHAGRLGVEILSLDDPRYPALLKEIFAPPPVLYVKGNLDVFSGHAVGIVGTRKPSTYGRNATIALTAGLASHGVAIISGLALGIDAIAHQTCLENNGRTVAVLGSGVEAIYPVTNARLASRIMENGALVSEFPIGTPPLAHHFPRRNRIISGLSAGILVIEAGQRSGSLITANYALQQGRDIFAVPGPIFAEKSIGTFNLIKQGATPVRGADDILQSIQTVTHRAAGSPVNTRAAAALLAEILPQREQDLLNVLSNIPMRMDEITTAINIPVTDLFDTILNLELKGLIRQMPGQTYVKAA